MTRHATAGPSLTIGVAAALIAGVTVGNVGANLMPTLLDDFTARFSMSESAAGGVAAAQLLTMALTTLLMARRAARPGRTRMARLGLTVGALGSLGAAVAQDPVTLTVANLVMGFGLGTLYAAATAALSAAGDADRASGVTILGTAVVTALLLVVVPSANGAWGGAGFLLLALVCAPAYWLVRRLPDVPGDQAGIAQSSDDPVGAGPGILLLVAAGGLAAATQGAWSYVAKLGREHTHMSSAGVSSVLGVAGVIAIAGAVLGPLAAVRWGRMRALAAFVSGESLTVLLVLVTESSAVFTVAAVFWQAFQLAILVELLAAAAEANPSGRWVAALSGASAVGAGIGPLVVGAALDAAGPNVLAVALAAGVLLASLPLLRMAAAHHPAPEPTPDAEPAT
ncbi:MFS transporter [Streptomyces cellulosae]|uniref:MFS transporter n=1 Tax=Streptomyces cellulosae TaxID=1968 RepID=UPI000690FD0A|nr:MFS transporter [Streptomyces cellulosae]